MIPARFEAVLAELAPLAAAFEAAGRPLYLVGGAVRDLLLVLPGARDRVDLDLTTPAHPEETKRLLKPLVDHIWPLGERFGTIAARRESSSRQTLQLDPIVR